MYSIGGGARGAMPPPFPLSGLVAKDQDILIEQS